MVDVVRHKTICLNMIVKNESHIISHTLNNILEHMNIDYWVISDTGSTDDTVNIIQDFFKERGISGEIFHDKWKDFGHNRTKALEHAYGKSDYLFIFDADDLIHGNIKLPSILDKDSYSLQFENPVLYHRTILISNRMKWKYAGVLHELLCNIDPIKSEDYLLGNYYIESRRLGDRSKNPNKYLDDAVVLEKGFEEENTNMGLKYRYSYYCAQSYHTAEKWEKAIEWYERTLTLDYSPQYKYCACIKAGDCYNVLKQYSNAFNNWSKAYTYDNERLEGIVKIMEYCYNKGQHFMVSSLYNKFKHLKICNPVDKIFLDYSKYHDFHYYASISGCYCDEHKSAYEACKYMLLNNRPNPGITINNLQFYMKHFKEDDDNKSLLDYFVTYIMNEQIVFKQRKSAWNIVNSIIKEQLSDKYEILENSILSPGKKNIDKNSKYASSKNILIYTGYMNFLWNDSTLNKQALGGSEKAVIYLSRCLPKNFEIYIAGDQLEEELDNIKYINHSNLQKLLDENNFHTIIVSRYVSFFQEFNNSKCYQLVLSAHDTYFLGNNNEIIKKHNKYIDNVVCLTEWHKNDFIGKYDYLKDKIRIINNGINITDFNNENISIDIKIKNKFVWTSRPERGLNILLELWPKILEKIPDATLDISSYDNFTEETMYIKNIIDKYHSITHHGKLNTKELYELMSISEYWLYTNTFPETGCITAMEMLMSGVICLYYPLAGLVDTIGDYGIQVKSGNEIETLMNLSEENKTELIKNGKEYALTCSWTNRAKQWINMLGLNKTNHKIGIFNSFPFHYEMFGFILNYAKNNEILVDIFTNTQNDLGWIDFYREKFNNFNVIDFKKFEGNTNNYSTFFVTTDDDPLFKTEWIDNNVVCLNHYYKIRSPNFKHYLNVANFKDSSLEYSYPCYPLINYQDKIQNNTVCVIGGGYGFNNNVINKLYSKDKIKLYIFTRKICNINISNIDINKFDIHFIEDIETSKMIKILKQSSYVLLNYNDNHELNTGNSCSGSLQLALSTLCKPIMAQTSNKYLQIENALEFDIDSDEPINIDREIDFEAIEQERNKYVDKFEILMNVYKITKNLNLNKHSISMDDFAKTINKFNLNLNNIFEIGSMNGFDANVLSQKCKVNDVHIFEAVPNYCKNMEKRYPSFKVNNCAVNNYNGTAKFNIIKGNNNYGISSLRNRNKDVVKDKEEYSTVEVNSTRMDKYIEDNNIKSIDICKIDVEGCSYEVLEGFGKYLNYIKCLHIESETIQYWENQKLTKDIFNLLENNFIRLSNSYNNNEKQIDSIFVNKNIIMRYINKSNIPKKIFQTWEHNDIEPEFQKIIDKWKEFNPDYEYIFHDSGQRLKFIEENFEETVVNAYNKIIPGAYKCDLWRYCVLYTYGGFYADIDTVCMGKLNDITRGNIDFIVPIDLNINPREGQHNLACGFIGSVPKSPILLDAINRIVFNVENNIIPTSKLDFSGPGLLGRAVNKFLKLEETISFVGKEGIQNNIFFLHFDPNTEYMKDVDTNKTILQNKNGNADIIRLYNNECNKIKNYTCWVSSNKIIK